MKVCYGLSSVACQIYEFVYITKRNIDEYFSSQGLDLYIALIYVERPAWIQNIGQ